MESGWIPPVRRYHREPLTCLEKPARDSGAQRGIGLVEYRGFESGAIHAQEIPAWFGLAQDKNGSALGSPAIPRAGAGALGPPALATFFEAGFS
jgi:hypothetical protein